MDINDDCLLTIFGFLTVMDLCSVAETCKRAEEIAKESFKFDHHKLNLPQIRFVDNLKSAARLLRNFGCVTKSLTVSCHRYINYEWSSRKILELVHRHCRRNVTELTLLDMIITSESINHLRVVFGSVKSLTCSIVFDNCTLASLNGNIEKLHLFNTEFRSPILHRTTYTPLTNFLQKAKDTLTQFSIFGCSNIPTKLFKIIGQMKHLQELKLHVNRINDKENAVDKSLIRGWGALKNLKVLTLRWGESSFELLLLLEELLANNVRIENSEIYNLLSDVLIEAVIKLKSINTLRLVDFEITDENLLHLAEGLTSLTKLKISGCVSENGIIKMISKAHRLSYLEIETELFDIKKNHAEVLKVLQKRPEHIKLELMLSSWFAEQSAFEIENNELLIVKKTFF